MDIKNLLAFIEVSEKRSFSLTAKSLNLTQPAVSKRIAALELALSAKLFDRAGHGVTLTEAGDVLLPHAKQISADLNLVEDALHNLGREVFGKLRVGTTPHIGTYHLAPVLKRLLIAYPEVQLDLQFGSPDNTITALENSQLEIALCALHGPAPQGLKKIDVCTEKLLVVVATDHPLALSESINVETLLNFSAVLPNAPSASRTIIDQALFNHTTEFNKSIGASDFESMKMMISIGLGWGFLPEKLIDNSLVVLDLPQLKLSQRISIIKRHNRTLSSAAQIFIDHLLAASS